MCYLLQYMPNCTIYLCILEVTMSTEKYLNKLNELITESIQVYIDIKLNTFEWENTFLDYFSQLRDTFVSDGLQWFSTYFRVNIYNIALKEAPDKEAPDKDTNYITALLFGTQVFKHGIVKDIHKAAKARWKTESAKRAATATRNEAQKETKGEFKQYNILDK